MRALIPALLVCGALAACRHAPAGNSDAADATDAAPAIPAAPSATASADRDAVRRSEAAESKRLNCRAIGKTGDVQSLSDGDAGIAPLALDSEIPSDAWLLISRGARVVAKDPHSTRETIFSGPARVRPCASHREDSWIASGTFESTPGAGETPGAEEWVVTPLAVVRYASAKLRVTVRPGTTVVEMGGGVAFVRAADDARVSRAAPSKGAPPDKVQKSDEPWVRIGEGSLEVRALRATPAPQAAHDEVDVCASLATRAQSLTRLILPHDIGDGGSATLADAIVEQVTTRRLARAACAVATLRTSALPASQQRALLESAVTDADARWSSLSPAPPPR